MSNWYSNPIWGKINQENLEKYGTTDFEEIKRMERYARKSVEAEAKTQAQAQINDMLPDIKKKARENALKEVRTEYCHTEGGRILGLSPFISEEVTVNGITLDCRSFIPDKPVNDPNSEETRLCFNDVNDTWVVIAKKGGQKLVSRFVVTACLIVDASAPGMCEAYAIFLKGESKPLVFWNGIIEPAELRRQTQFHQKGLSYGRKDLYHESFLRALTMCRAVYFFTLPGHAGWNATTDGRLIFVSAAMNIPLLSVMFGDRKGQLRNVVRDIILNPTERELESIVADYHKLLPDALPVKIGTAISAMARLLPQYKEAGIVQDRPWVFETSDDETTKAMISIIQNRNHSSTEVLFSSMRLPYIEEEINKYIDCVAILRHSSAACSTYDANKVFKFLFGVVQNGFGEKDNGRLVPVLFIDNAGIIPEEFQVHKLLVIERFRIINLERLQKMLGELDYHIVKNAERNPDAVHQRLKKAITGAKEKVSTLPRRSQSNSAIMLLATAIMLKDGGILTETDVLDILEWLRTEAKAKTSMSHSIYKAVGNSLSRLICNGRLPIAKQYGPPFWSSDKAFVAVDDSLNVTKDTWENEILPEMPVGRNKVLQYLSEEDVLFTNKGEETRTWTVQNEEGIKKPKRFYSFSRDILTTEANRKVDEAVASDLFHKPDKTIDNFFPFIKHKHLDMVAGQVITDYKHGNPFIAVTGTPGSGKTDWMMQQVILRAKAGDVVVVLDPTNAFCREELVGHKISEDIIDDYFNFWDMSTQGWPVNILDFEDCDDLTQRVQKLSSLLISGMHLTGVNQKALVSTTAKDWLMECEFDNKLSIYDFPDRFVGDPDNEKLKMRLDALLSTIKDMGNTVQPPGWDKLLSERGKVLVISAGSATINVEANPFDVLLDTIYSFKDKNRDAKLTLVLDEVQTLNHHKSSTLVNILSRVRKLNISAMLASQDYSNISLKKIYDYCGTHILFRPLGEECIKAVAELTKLDISVIRTLPDFCCAIMGSIYSKYNQKNIQLSSAVIGETYRPSYVRNYDINERP